MSLPPSGVTKNICPMSLQKEEYSVHLQAPAGCVPLPQDLRIYPPCLSPAGTGRRGLFLLHLRVAGGGTWALPLPLAPLQGPMSGHNLRHPAVLRGCLPGPLPATLFPSPGRDHSLTINPLLYSPPCVTTNTCNFFGRTVVIYANN